MSTTAKERRLIESTYGRLVGITESAHYFERCVKMHTQEEREHRAGNKGDYKMPLGLAGNYFAVKWVFSYLNCAAIPAEEMLTIRPAVLYSAGVAAKYQAKINAEFSPEEIAQFLALDYAKMVE